MQLAQSRSMGELKNPLKKSSSCSTIFIDDSTVSQPNLKNTIKCVALAIYYHIKNRTSEQIIDIFDERSHPLTVQILSIKESPEHKSPLFDMTNIYFHFSEILFQMSTINITLNTVKFIGSSAPCSMQPSLLLNVPSLL